MAISRQIQQGTPGVHTETGATRQTKTMTRVSKSTEAPNAETKTAKNNLERISNVALLSLSILKVSLLRLLRYRSRAPASKLVVSQGGWIIVIHGQVWVPVSIFFRLQVPFTGLPNPAKGIVGKSVDKALKISWWESIPDLKMPPVVILMWRHIMLNFPFPNLKTFYFVNLKQLKEGGGCLRTHSTSGSAISECVTFNK